ncbi:MAG: amino acid ABC transporter substrate-binding protein, partial [Candidatus Rokubacteria bacterium]|nr:amino acid ABC transporter substrate-binding protein [Candidatus Rokubacteria bacterium]
MWIRLLCVAAFALLGFVADASAASVKVGVVGPYTGSSAPFGIS